MITIKGYTITIIQTKEELEKAVNQNIDIIQFDFLSKEAGQPLHKVTCPKGYKYGCFRNTPYGSLVQSDLNMKVMYCFYKKELQSKINDILN